MKKPHILLAVLGILLLFVSWQVGSFVGMVGQRRADAGELYPKQIAAAYESSIRGETDHLNANPIFKYVSEDFLALDEEFGAVEEYKLDYMEPHFLGVHHQFIVNVKRDNEWSTEYWFATDLRPFTDVKRADGTPMFED
ncbi:MAG: hypothetical protein IH944_12250 [Armatimonadetes bacterium]|nr:hypothetical protein [Armatimonadota bacterium]